MVCNTVLGILVQAWENGGSCRLTHHWVLILSVDECWKTVPPPTAVQSAASGVAGNTVLGIQVWENGGPCALSSHPPLGSCTFSRETQKDLQHLQLIIRKLVIFSCCTDFCHFSIMWFKAFYSYFEKQCSTSPLRCQHQLAISRLCLLNIITKKSALFRISASVSSTQNMQHFLA